MKRIGIIIEYDGYNGCLIDTVNYKKYLVMKKDIINNQILTKGDLVKYDSELVKGKKLIARFIEKK